MDDQHYLRLTEPERAAEDARAAAALDAEIRAARVVFQGNATACRAVVEVATRDLEECLRGPQAEYYAPKKRAALELAQRQAANWTARDESAAAGRLRMTQAEVGDVEYMRFYGGLLATAQAQGRVDSGPAGP